MDITIGKIYIIRCIRKPELIYVGSTILKLQTRLSLHRSDCVKCSNYKIHKAMRLFGMDNFFIELYQELIITDRKDKQEMYVLEGIAQVLLGSTLNKNIAGRTAHQFYLDNREAITTRQNKKNLCDVCGGKYTNRNKATHLKSNKHTTSESEF